MFVTITSLVAPIVSIKGAAPVVGSAGSANLDIDALLAANSDTRVASQKAVKSYVDARSADAASRLHVTPGEYGAVGNGTTDDAAAMLLALQSGRVVDGGGRTYALGAGLTPASFTGLQNCKLKWANTTVMATQAYLLSILDKNDWFIDNCSFDLGTVENTGSADDSSRGGLRITSATPNVAFNKRVSITRNRFTGYGNGTSLYVRSCQFVMVAGNLVYDRIVAFSPDPTNDCQNGIDVSQCLNAVVQGNIVSNLKTRLLGALARRYSRGMLFFELRHSAVVGNSVTDCDQNYDFSGTVNATNPNGNTGLTVTGNSSDNCYTYGFKFANVMTDSVISGNIARRFGLAGFVFSGQSSAGDFAYDPTKTTQRLTVTGNRCVDATGEFSSSNRGFWIAQQAASVGYPRGIQMANNTVHDTIGANLLYGFQNEVVYDGTSLLLNELNNCRSKGHLTAASTGFTPWRTSLKGSNSQAIVTATPTNLTWDTEILDGPAAHAPSDHTINAKVAGTYRITIDVCFASNATGYRLAKVLVNGGTTAGGQFSANAVNGVANYIGGSLIIPLAAGDGVRVEVTQNSGGTLNVDLANSLFTMELVEIT